MWVCAVGPKDFLFLEHLLHGFDTCDALEPNASIVVHFELDAQPAPSSLHDLELLLLRVPFGVPVVQVHHDFTTGRHGALLVELHRHVEEFHYGRR